MREGLTANLQQWPLVQALTMLVTSRQTGIVELTDGAAHAELALVDGAIVDASDGLFSGEEALPLIARWFNGMFVFDATARAVNRSITRPVEEVLSEIIGIAADAAAVRAVVPSVTVIPTLNHHLPDGPITLTPPEWQVVSFADGRTDVAGICSLLGRDALSVSRVLVRLVGAGLLSIAKDGPAVQAQPAAPAVRGVPRAEVAPAAAAPNEAAGPVFLERLDEALRLAVGPIASVAVEDQLKRLGASPASLARESASTLVERLAAEIADPRRRVAFTQAMLPELRHLAKRADAA